VLNVEKPLMEVLILPDIKEFTLGRSPTNMTNVERPSIWAHISLDTENPQQRKTLHIK
jgi:hypothetical protein